MTDSDPLAVGAGMLEGFDVGGTSRARRRALFVVAAGMFVDGYDLILLSGALVQLHHEWDLSAGQIGFLGASTYFGSMFGAILFGHISDKVGRRSVFNWTLVSFLVISVLSAFVSDVGQLTVMRILLGVAIGAEIAAGFAFLGEISPSRSRGGWGGALPQITWSLGALAAIFVDALLLTVAGENAWRWILVSGAVPALIVLAARWSLPESPRWLLLKGRTDEAARALRYFGVTMTAEQLGNAARTVQRSVAETARSSELLRASLTGRYKRVAILVIVLVGPASLVGGGSSILGPYVFDQLGHLTPVQSVLSGSVIWVGALIGSVLSFSLIDRLGRIRAYTIGQVALFVIYLLMITIGFGTWLLVPMYLLYGVFNWMVASVNSVLPAELLPTAVRGSVTGIAHGINRLCNGLAVLLVPVGLELLGFRAVVVICGAIGLLLSAVAWANRRYDPARRSIDEVSEGIAAEGKP
ncbi:MFS transporter [Tsukamurella spumae]|uniref:Sugar porter family MFS transporter n=1 Tax=Tsukamurella spumae TaxID=44753 RepID=A0A846WW76_9ACTN|nr:MFS transporter [Tsukamurella spumae]NKY17181.1 sugar porter family MFS transporter [Tsukamurella spumae]